MIRGSVVHWYASYGKIRARGIDFFVHRADLEDVLSLAPGDLVEFEPVDIGRGPRAERVRVLEGTATISFDEGDAGGGG